MKNFVVMNGEHLALKKCGNEWRTFLFATLHFFQQLNLRHYSHPAPFNLSVPTSRGTSYHG